MFESRILVAAVFVLSAVACGGSVRVDGGAGAEGGAVAGHAGAPYSPGAAGAQHVDPVPGGAPGAGGIPSVGGESPGSAGSSGAPSPGGAPNMGGNPNAGGGSPASAGSAGEGTAAGSAGMGGDGSCLLSHTRYPNGATWACDCNTCFCLNGTIGSSAVECFACYDGGKGHFYGETFSTNGCNRCTCGADGAVACNEKPCECNPGGDGLHYVATDLHKCAAIEYECPGLTKPFQNACGCGCAQAADCPTYIDCSASPEPPSACETLRLKCPYSGFPL